MARLVLPIPPGPVIVTSRLPLEQRCDGVDVLVASDEARQALRKVADTGCRGPKRREVVPKPRNVELVQPLGPRDVAQGVGAEIADLDAVGQRVGDQRPRRIGQEDLATMTAAAIRAARLTSNPP